VVSHYHKLVYFCRKVIVFAGERASGIFDGLLLALRIHDNRIAARAGQNRTLIFVGQVLNHRVLKHAKYLKRSLPDTHIVLLIHTSGMLSDLSAGHCHQVLVLSQTDELIGTQNKDTAWNYFCICFKP